MATAIILCLTSLLTSHCAAALSIRQSDGTLEVKYRLEEEQEVGMYDDVTIHATGSATLMTSRSKRPEQEVGMYVGNVREDTHLASLYSADVVCHMTRFEVNVKVTRPPNLETTSGLYSADVMHKLQFRFLRQHQQSLPFSVNVDTGIITTSGRVDRDAICPGAETCDVKLDVAVQPAQYFRSCAVLPRHPGHDRHLGHQRQRASVSQRLRPLSDPRVDGGRDRVSASGGRATSTILRQPLPR